MTEFTDEMEVSFATGDAGTQQIDADTLEKMVSQARRSGDATVRSPVAPTDALVVIRYGEGAVVVEPTADRDNVLQCIQIPSDSSCPLCEDDAKYTPSMGEATMTAYNRRRQAACGHRETILDAQHLDDACPDCGSWVVEDTEFEKHGRVVLVEYHCSECGAFRGC